MSRKPSPTRRTIVRIVYLDPDDRILLEKLPEAVWVETMTDAFAHCIRLVQRWLEKSPNAYRRFTRAAQPGVWTEGVAQNIRLNSRELQALEEIQELTELDRMTDVVRLIIRMGAEHYGVAVEE